MGGGLTLPGLYEQRVGTISLSQAPISQLNENAELAVGAAEYGGYELETIGPLDHVVCTWPMSGTSSTMSH